MLTLYDSRAEWDALMREGENITAKFAELEKSGQEILRYANELIRQESEQSCNEINSQKSEADKSLSEKSAAAPWAKHLLKLPTSKLFSTVKSKVPKAFDKQLPHPQTLAADNKLNENFIEPVHRQALLRIIRGDYSNMSDAMQDLAHQQRMRSTIKAQDLGKPLPSVGVPYNTETDAFRGLSGGLHGTEFRNESIANGKLMQSTGPDTRVFYASRPEYAAAYSKTLNPQHTINSKFPAQVSPLATDQKFVVNVKTDDINPVLQHVTSRNMNNQPTYGYLDTSPEVPWTKANMNMPYEERDLAQQLSLLKAAKEKTPEGLPWDYEVKGLGNDIPIEMLYRITQTPKPYPQLSLKEKLRFDHARRLKEETGDIVAPNTGLVETELRENPTETVRRALSFFNRYSE
jgi:hypothetical protein